jgi:hypothetical protein
LDASGLKVRLGSTSSRVEWTEARTLYEQRRCRVELRFRARRAPTRGRLDRHRGDSPAGRGPPAAHGDPAWNRRRVEDYPANWERTRQAYEVWKAAQVNQQVSRKLDEALEQAERVVERSEDSEEYAAAFLQGVRERRYESFTSCASALAATFYVRGSGPGDRRGWEDGQRLAWSVQLAAELRKCFVAAPPPPPGLGPGRYSWRRGQAADQDDDALDEQIAPMRKSRGMRIWAMPTPTKPSEAVYAEAMREC